ncbi:hypothetical protein J4760_02495 [Salinicoccus sp. ID82-1]|uniref:Uncharacterized protein n=1 Tax=Salinicoccus cyprini TaxID=2493691 RepID=A0A558AYP3_9STAP|nr:MULTISPECIES: hypothetical protein [Salinicoccus]MCG1008918.1 hypothetical protein [Salinicoccus sp. ID82-1]TVT29378.1 hypothetical protein FO441_03590 [Salinicoccus cyprini]
MEIIPLLIFIGGIIYTAIAGQKNKDKDGERNIDPSKMDRPTGPSAPRRRQSDIPDRPKGLFDDLFGEVERRLSGEEQQTRQTTGETRSSRPANERPARQSSQRPMTERSFGRTLEEKAKDTNVGRRAMNTYEEKAQEVRQRADQAEQRVQEVRSNSRYDRTRQSEIETGGRGSQRRQPVHEQPKPKVRRESLSFGRKDIVNGVIFSEIIGKPKSRK